MTAKIRSSKKSISGRAPSKPSNDLKLWQLLRIGLRDLHKQETSPKCRVEMSCWLRQSRRKVCSTCLAGSVMHWSLGLDVAPHYRDMPKWAYAIDSLRNGSVTIALAELGRSERPGERFDFYATSYHLNREAWWDEMRELLRVLKEADL